MSPRIPEVWKYCLSFTDEEIKLQRHCCAIDRVDGYMLFQFLSSDNCPWSVSQKCIFSSDLSAQNTEESKTTQDALAETVSV